MGYVPMRIAACALLPTLWAGREYDLWSRLGAGLERWRSWDSCPHRRAELGCEKACDSWSALGVRVRKKTHRLWSSLGTEREKKGNMCLKLNEKVEGFASRSG